MVIVIAVTAVIVVAVVSLHYYQSGHQPGGCFSRSDHSLSNSGYSKQW